MMRQVKSALLAMVMIVTMLVSNDMGLYASTDIVFKFQAPHAKKVKIYGSFNGWSKGYLLLKNGSDIWVQSVELPRGRYEYKYLVDGKWMYDAKLPTINDGLYSKNNVIVIR